MSTSSIAPRAERPGLAPPRAYSFQHISWDEYEALLTILDEQPVRLTYDRGRLEIMTLSAEHEWARDLIRLLLAILGDFFDLSMGCLGSTTYKRKDLLRGLEPDQCFYLRNLRKIRGKKRIDLNVDPPPDLALEVDVTSSSIDRLGIYAALKVPEIWHYDGKVLHALLLQKDGSYHEAEVSLAIPMIRVADLLPFVRLGLRKDDKSMMRAFRAWLQENFAEKA